MRLGVDLGGTKIEIAALAADGQIVLRRRVPTPQGDYAATVRAVAALVAACEAELGGRLPVGVGMPGALSGATGRVKNANSVCLIGRPLGADLEAALGRPVRLANDANCFALSEASDGAAAGAASVFGVILGTGVGGGLVLDGKIVPGANAIAGEWGHNPLPWPEADELPGPECYCGRRGCVETWLSGPGLLRDFHRHGGEAERAEQVVAAAERGEEAARACLDRYATRLARALATVINIIDPAVIVLGGGLSNVPLWYRVVPGRWGRWVFSDTVSTRLLAPAHGDSSGVRGAAWLWPGEEG